MKRAVENLLFVDPIELNDDLCLVKVYTEAYYSEKRGLAVYYEGEEITNDVEEELKDRLIAYFKEWM
ncbi:hypothetical protein KY339_00970 [Candidatus Woesearchaeota archaeon]|nr:hypothetical protein [Candidatus Woesearchaeota archaeon]